MLQERELGGGGSVDDTAISSQARRTVFVVALRKDGHLGEDFGTNLDVHPCGEREEAASRRA